MPRRPNLVEARPTLLAEATDTAGQYRVQLINPGWGSSGYYSAPVLAEAARARVFPAGLPMYCDHPSVTEATDRPERSIRDLWGRLVTDATLEESTGALVADVQVFSPYRPLIEDLRDTIGLSIRGAGQMEMGEAEGRKGRLITAIEHALSVDFVTAAGRGGRILELVENADTTPLTEGVARVLLAEARNVGAWLESRLHLTFTHLADDMYGEGRLTREERIALSSAVGDGLAAFVNSVMDRAPQLYERDLWAEPTAIAAEEAARLFPALTEATADERREQLHSAVKLAHGGDGIYAWVRDFDDDTRTVWFQISADDEPSRLMQQTYTPSSDDLSVSLDGQPDEVRAVTKYVPVTPAGQSTDTTESEEDTMPQIEEARLRQLEADAGRVQTLEAERDAATQRATVVEQQLAESNARTAARPIVVEVFAEHQLPASTYARVTESLVSNAPLTDQGTLDEAALRTAATAAQTAAETELAEALAAAGVGRPRGLGAAAEPLTEADGDYEKTAREIARRRAGLEA